MTPQAYVDDLTIEDQDELLRRIFPGWWIFDKNLGSLRPTSQAFKNHRDGSPMSVYLQKELDEHGLNPESVLAGHEDFALASITAGLARQCEQGVMKRPDIDLGHAEVFGEKTDSVRRKFAENSIWVVLPNG